MKKLLFNLIVLMILSGVNAYAFDNTPFVTFKSQQQSIAVYLNETEKEDATIIIKDAALQTLFSERVKNTMNYARLFNLKTLEEGAYTFIIELEQKTIVQPIIVKGNKVEIQQDQFTYFHPVVRQRGSMIAIDMLTLDRTGELVLEDETGNILYTDQLSTLKYNKLLNVEKLEKGRYNLKISTPEKTYVETIIK